MGAWVMGPGYGTGTWYSAVRVKWGPKLASPPLGGFSFLRFQHIGHSVASSSELLRTSVALRSLRVGDIDS